jgi:hypothetical protein
MDSQRFLSVLVSLTFSAVITAAPATADLLTPRLKAGEHYSNVFSIASSVQAPGYDELVRRNGGTADYSVTSATPDGSFSFNSVGVYFGQPIGQGSHVTRDGGATNCTKDQCRTYTDASGLVYNRLLWGVPPANLRAGLEWTVSIDQPWEMGAAGTQKVTVVGVDAADGTVTLKREGTASGLFADESTEVPLTKDGKTFKLTRTAGEAHWIGYTTFRNGVVWSDELMVVRTDELHSADTGTVTATKRMVMLLNASPFPTISPVPATDSKS